MTSLNVKSTATRDIQRRTAHTTVDFRKKKSDRKFNKSNSSDISIITSSKFSKNRPSYNYRPLNLNEKFVLRKLPEDVNGIESDISSLTSVEVKREKSKVRSGSPKSKKARKHNKAPKSKKVLRNKLIIEAAAKRKEALKSLGPKWSKLIPPLILLEREQTTPPIPRAPRPVGFLLDPPLSLQLPETSRSVESRQDLPVPHLPGSPLGFLLEPPTGDDSQQISKEQRETAQSVSKSSKPFPRDRQSISPSPVLERNVKQQQKESSDLQRPPLLPAPQTISFLDREDSFGSLGSLPESDKPSQPEISGEMPDNISEKTSNASLYEQGTKNPVSKRSHTPSPVLERNVDQLLKELDDLQRQKDELINESHIGFLVSEPSSDNS